MTSSSRARRPASSARPVPPTRPAPSSRPVSARRQAMVRGTALVLALILGLVAAAGAIVAGAGPANAHNRLVTSEPADGSTVAVAPEHVVLTFGEPARALGTEVVVTAPDGTVVSAGAPVLTDHAVSQQLTGALPAGAYAVQWRVTSEDGHPIEGASTFTASAATTIGTVASTEVPVAESSVSADPTDPAVAEPSPSTTGGSTAEGTAAPGTSDSGSGGAPSGAAPGAVLGGVLTLLVAVAAAGVLIARRRSA